MVELTVEKRVGVPPETVYDALLDAATARNFMFATDGGEMIVARADPRVGGEFEFTERRGADEVRHQGQYLALNRPRLVMFSLKVGEDISKVTVHIEPATEGSQVTLVHEVPDKWAGAAEKTRDGWSAILQGLAHTVGG